MIIINGELAEQFSYDEAGLMQAVQAYAAAKSQGGQVDLVIDMTKAGPDLSGIMEQVAPFMIPYEGSQEMLKINVEELAGSAGGATPAMGDPAGGPPSGPPGMSMGAPAGGPPGMGGPAGGPPGMGGPPGGPPGMGGPPADMTMANSTGGDPMQGAGGATSAEGDLADGMVQKARKIIKPHGKKGGYAV